MSASSWDDGLGHRSRKAWCILIAGDSIHVFVGESIPGVVAVVGSDYNKNGKWSSSTYRMELAAGVRMLSGHDGWETGTFREGLRSETHKPTDTWLDLANALGVTLPAAQAFLRAWRPLAAQHYDEVDAALAAVDGESDGVETATLSFGSPTNRQIREGYWECPVVVLNENDETVDSFAAPEFTRGTTGAARMLEVVRSPGMHGGYVSVRVAVPVGCRLSHGHGRTS